MLPQDPGVFSQSLLSFQPQDPLMMEEEQGLPPPIDTMGMEPPDDSEMNERVENLIREYLYEKGRQRLEATQAYQESVAAANASQF